MPDFYVHKQLLIIVNPHNMVHYMNTNFKHSMTTCDLKRLPTYVHALKYDDRSQI